MTKDYDAIVIGAGLGGLAAATTLAHNGLSVLLLERHNVPGGYATSSVRGRYEFEVALHELSGTAPPGDRGNVYRVLEYLGVADKVKFLHVPELYRAVFLEPSDGQSAGCSLDVTLPAGREAFEAKLVETFPHEVHGIRRFLQRVFDFGRDHARFLRQRRQVHPATIPLRFRHFVRYLPATWGKVLDRDIQAPPSQISFVFLASTLAAYVRRGVAFPQGRSQALSNAFLARFEELGGETRLNCSVRQITTENGRVTGVFTEQGDEIRAGWIVSNADPVATGRDLIGREKIPGSFFSDLRSNNVAASTVNVYLGLACPHDELGLTEHEIFVNKGYDFERNYAGMKVIAPPEAIALTCYSAACPKISPPGTSMVVLTALAYGKPWSQVPPHEYVDTKNHIAGSMIDLAETIAPGLRHHADVVEVSTPLTNMRYTGAMGGSIYGFSQPPCDNMVWRMGYKGPLDGLYFAGAWTQPGGGFEPAIMSGIRAGRAISYKSGRM